MRLFHSYREYLIFYRNTIRRYFSCLVLSFLTSSSLLPLHAGGMELPLEENNAVKLDKNIPQPPHQKILKNPSSEAAKLKTLLDEGKLREFYMAARPLFLTMDPVEDGDFTADTLADRLWVYYYYTAAPVLPTDTQENRLWAGLRNHVDILAKNSVGGFIGRHEPELLAKRLPYRKQELAELLAAYYAGVMKTFYTNYDPWWKEKEKVMQEEKKKNWHKMNQDERIEWNNKINFTGNRNNMAGNRLRFKEKDFVRFLMDCFPGKGAQIRKYITMAGYRDDEIEELIALTVGKNAKTEFLLKGLPNRGRKKADENRRQAVARDVAL